MDKKKNTYASKHQNSGNEIISWVRENADLWEIFRKPYDFENIFAKLPYERQLKFLKMIQSIQKDQVTNLPASHKKILQYTVAEFFEKIQWMTDSVYEEGNVFYPLATDEKRLVRMECYGTINARNPYQLSTCYKFFTAPEHRLSKKCKLKEYDLSVSPMWRVFNQFESFRAIAPHVRKYLYYACIHPDVLKVMSVNDFCDIIHKSFSKEAGRFKAQFMKVPLKNRFVMDFMKHRGKDFRKYLKKQHIDDRLIFTLCRAMEQFGVCDPCSLVVVETHFTARVLDDLQDHGYDISNYKLGDAIPLKLIDDILEERKGHLLAARDKDGKLLDKSVLPKLEVHHATGVQFAHSNSGGKLHYERYLAQINYPGNLILVESNLHRIFYHGYDSIIQSGKNTECYFSRINTNNPLLSLICGFSSQDQIYCDLQKNAAFKRRETKDKENVVNYFKMQLERLGNIQIIAKKYGISYSLSQLKEDISEMQNAIHINKELTADVISGLNTWLKGLKREKKINKKLKAEAKKGNTR